MAFTLEDGTGVTGANAYISAAYYTTHHTDRGRSGLPTIPADPIIEAAIVRATDYVEKRWRTRFKGRPLLSTQGLHFPAIDAYDRHERNLSDDAVPVQMEKAVAEYALMAIRVGVIAPNPAHHAPAEAIDGTIGDAGLGQVTQEKVDVIDTKYAKTTDRRQPWEDTSLPEVPEADNWIKELLNPRSRQLGRA